MRELWKEVYDDGAMKGQKLDWGKVVTNDKGTRKE